MEREEIIRLSVYFGIFVLLALWELSRPRRRLTMSRSIRWFSNIGLTFLNTLLIPLIVTVVAMDMARMAQERGWGFFNNVNAPYAVAFIATIILLDFVIYLQHVMFHAVPILWRLHRVHHSDVDLDVTSGARFHTVEILISLGIKVAAITLVGPPILAILAFEILLNGTAMFNHANVRLPLGLDRILRLVVVTPDMHRVHHSIIRAELDSNFGFNLPWWDYLCGTYRAQPVHGHDGMTVGVTQFREPKDQYLHRLLVQPFVRDTSRRVEMPSSDKIAAPQNHDRPSADSGAGLLSAEGPVEFGSPMSPRNGGAVAAGTRV